MQINQLDAANNLVKALGWLSVSKIHVYGFKHINDNTVIQTDPHDELPESLHNCAIVQKEK